jgi:hypothetical protein
MSTETLEILGGIFASDIPNTTHFDADQLRREYKLNIADNLRLATTPQRHPPLQCGNRKTDSMAKKDKTAEVAVADTGTEPKEKRTRKGVKRGGKFAFIKALIGGGTLTYDEIVVAAAKEFPAWDEKLVKCGVFSARTQMRKAGLTANWAADPAPDPVAEEKPHIAQAAASAEA